MNHDKVTLYGKMTSVHSGACGAPRKIPAPHRPAGRGGASFWVPRSLPRSGAPPFNGGPPSAPRFFSGVDRAFYGRDRIFYGRDGVFRTICELPAYFNLLRYAGEA